MGFEKVQFCELEGSKNDTLPPLSAFDFFFLNFRLLDVTFEELLELGRWTQHDLELPMVV